MDLEGFGHGVLGRIPKCCATLDVCEDKRNDSIFRGGVYISGPVLDRMVLLHNQIGESDKKEAHNDYDWGDNVQRGTTVLTRSTDSLYFLPSCVVAQSVYAPLFGNVRSDLTLGTGHTGVRCGVLGGILGAKAHRKALIDIRTACDTSARRWDQLPSWNDAGVDGAVLATCINAVSDAISSHRTKGAGRSVPLRALLATLWHPKCVALGLGVEYLHGVLSVRDGDQIVVAITIHITVRDVVSLHADIDCVILPLVTLTI
mmetsp:Transcript_832/g.1436  ORF Transcript_832/g.1436 Transcript_832/m.1436 type:complete len:259 (+) Transcript_832:1092-1868(+)